MNKIEVYTDGACSGNPGKGGYAFVILHGEKEILKLSGCDEQTTNNRMELKAIVRSLQHVISEFREMKDVLVVIHSDSAYCINPVDKGWINFWSKNNWKTKSNEKIKNDDEKVIQGQSISLKAKYRNFEEVNEKFQKKKIENKII